MQQHPSSSPIRVALVEDDVSFQNALKEAIQAAPDMALLSVAGTRAQGLQMLDEVQADVLLVHTSTCLCNNKQRRRDFISFTERLDSIK